ncbi:DUF2158 domain-containing protein [Aeromonas caviae]|uniref:DUF2158 domain-containing protein n=1 Tax=Aeromonas caviae TaxID=648 RepID=UPI0015DC4749|nr:DUF2158 domain-containing protein [Aeromonas caviae]MCR3947758.1 YodC family protein [Aeromonas caviae]MDH0317458.1 YodC family protein [Aeromonas caviae]MDH1451880.1 YodC family protein [Aeromonas caviae]MDH1456022.1 YodC family protein [Aeromonas caviae]MDH1496802.1 YodC family protein [Aeromonas caviae]
MTQQRQPLYEIGDIVKLSAGGPDMAIESIIPISYNNDEFSGNYNAQWFAGKKIEKSKFPEESLTLIRKKGAQE